MPKKGQKLTAEQKAKLAPTQFRRIDYVYSAEKYLDKNGAYNRDKLLNDALRVAKSTNQRLLRLEKAGYTNAPAYRGAKKALSGVYSKGGSVSFGGIKNGKPRYASVAQIKKMSNDELLTLLYAASATQRAKSSTITGVEAIYNKGYEKVSKLAKKYNIKLSLNDFMNLLKNEAISKASKLYGYQNILQTVDEVGVSSQDDIEAFAEAVAMATAALQKDDNVNVLELRRYLGLPDKETAEKVENTKFLKSF